MSIDYWSFTRLQKLEASSPFTKRPNDKPLFFLHLSLSPLPFFLLSLLALHMASSVRAAALGFNPVHLCARSTDSSVIISPSSLSFKRSFSHHKPLRLSLCHRGFRRFTVVPFAASGETTEAEEVTAAAASAEQVVLFVLLVQIVDMPLKCGEISI